MSSIAVAWNPRSANTPHATSRICWRRCWAGRRVVTGAASRTRLQGHLVPVHVIEVPGPERVEAGPLVGVEGLVGRRRVLDDLVTADHCREDRRERGVGEDPGDRGLTHRPPRALPEEREGLGLVEVVEHVV